MANETIKNILIDIGNSLDIRFIGAEGQYVEVARDSNGTIIEDITIEAPYQNKYRVMERIDENHIRVMIL